MTDRDPWLDGIANRPARTVDALAHLPQVSEREFDLLVKAHENLYAFVVVVARQLGVDPLTLSKAVQQHGARRVLAAAGLL